MKPEWQQCQENFWHDLKSQWVCLCDCQDTKHNCYTCSHSKTNKVHVFYSASCKTKLNFVNWYLDTVHTGATNRTLIPFSNKNWFHLSGYVKSLTITGTGLHTIPCISIQCFVWHATNVSNITGSILFSETINSPQFPSMCQTTKELTRLFWTRQWNSSHSTFFRHDEYKLNIHCNILN